MADGSRSHSFNFPTPQPSALRPGEIIVDLFAGGGGASEALKQAIGRDPDIAINHDEWAVGMHAANHPLTQHLREDVWHADPVRQVAGRAVGWFHASPDCTHFSQAKGGQPRSRATRSLSWVVLKWAGALAKAGNAPRIISLENVEQILKWGPLVAKRDKATGRVITLEQVQDRATGRMTCRVADPGEQVSVWNQQLIPDKRHAGRTWRQFIAALRALGYTVEWRRLTASDFGAGTSRKRLFLIARRDTTAIQWPAPTHGTAPGLLPLVTAADCIDFSDRGPSIFTRKKPLADATLRRIAKGLRRYVLEADDPFLVPTGERHEGTVGRRPSQWRGTDGREAGGSGGAGLSSNLRDRGRTCAERKHHLDGSRACIAVRRGSSGRLDECARAAAESLETRFLTEHANASAARSWSVAEPLRTQCANVKGGHFALAAAHLVKFRGDSIGTAADAPVPTITSGAGAKRPAGAAHALGVVTAFLEQANTGMVGHSAREPVSTIVGAGSTQRLVTANLCTLRHHSTGSAATEPLSTIAAGGEHHAVIECTLSPEHEAGAQRVAAFLIKYYGTALGVDIAEPLDTITTRDRLALVTVTIQGTPYVIVDIGLRMLRRAELFRAQGFPPDYIIDRTADGRPLSISRSVKMVGNSVSPPPLLAIARANLAPVDVPEQMAA